MNIGVAEGDDADRTATAPASDFGLDDHECSAQNNTTGETVSGASVPEVVPHKSEAWVDLEDSKED